MKKVLAFAGSNSPNSINQQLVTYSSSLLNESPSTLINLRDFPMKVYDLGIEEKHGSPRYANLLRDLFKEHDGFIISVSENNQSVSAVFKNTVDWLSRAGDGYNVFEGKPVLLLGTSPGPNGAQKAIDHASDIIGGIGGKVVGKFSLPRFYDNIIVDRNGKFRSILCSSF